MKAVELLWRTVHIQVLMSLLGSSLVPPVPLTERAPMGWCSYPQPTPHLALNILPFFILLWIELTWKEWKRYQRAQVLMTLKYTEAKNETTKLAMPERNKKSML